MTSSAVPTYCQSIHQLKKPSPSSPLAPPNRYVNLELCWFARQKIDIPAVSGKMYSGINSQMMMKPHTHQKTFSRRLASALSRCSDWNRDARGN